MGIQRLHLVTLLVATLLMGGLAVSGAIQSFREEEVGRTEELTTNIFRNMQHNIEELVVEVDAYLSMHPDHEVRHDPMRFFSSSHIRNVHWDAREDAVFWPLADDEVVTGAHYNVQGRNYVASIVMTPGAYRPMLRIEPMYQGDHGFRALYFSARAMMDIELVQDAAAIAFNTSSNTFVGVYPMVLSTRNATSMARMADMARKRYTVGGERDSLLKIGSTYFSEFSMDSSGGLLIGRESAPWHAFSWLPSHGGWWWMLAFSLAALVGASWLMVYRVLYRPIRLASHVLDGKWDEPTSVRLQAAVAHKWLPFEIRLLLRQIRQIAFARHQDTKGALMHSDVSCFHQEAFEAEIEEAVVEDTYLGGGSLVALHLGEVAEMRQCYRREDYRAALEEVRSAICDFTISEIRECSDSSDDVILGYLGNGEFLMWMTGDCDIYKMAHSLHRFITGRTYRFGRLTKRRTAVVAYPGATCALSPSKMLETLLFALRSIRRRTYFDDSVVLVDRMWKSYALQEQALTLIAQRGFTPQDIKLRYTPMVENASGETQCLMATASVVNDEIGEFAIDRAMEGLWEHNDRYETLVRETLMGIAHHIALLDKAGFARVKIAIRATPHQLYRHAWREAVCASTSSLLKDRLIIEVEGNPADWRHIEACTELNDVGFMLAYRHGIEQAGLQTLTAPVYIVYAASEFTGRASDYHQVQTSARNKGIRLINDTSDANAIFNTSLFYHTNDWSLIESRSDLGISDVLAFLQDDISLNVIMPCISPDSEEVQSEKVITVNFGGR